MKSWNQNDTVHVRQRGIQGCVLLSYRTHALKNLIHKSFVNFKAEQNIIEKTWVMLTVLGKQA